MGYQPGKKPIWFRVLLILLLTSMFCCGLYDTIHMCSRVRSKVVSTENGKPAYTSPWYRISFPITITEPLSGELSMHIRIHEDAPEVTMVQALKYDATYTSNVVLNSSDKIKYCKCTDAREENDGSSK